MTDHGHHQAERSIALIGYRGSGKTTVGRELAAMMAVPFVDTDEMIVNEAGKPISELFAKEGEQHFRKLENNAIRDLKSTRPSIISVGGGAVIDPENVAALRHLATVVWLTASADVLADRILGDARSADSRPALSNQSSRDEVKKVLHERFSFYEEAADHTVNTEDQTPAEIASRILAIVQS